MRQRIPNFRARIAIALLGLTLAACASATPTPLALPTRAQPEDLAQHALADALSELEYDLSQARSLLVYMSNAPQVTGTSEGECDTFVKNLLRTNPQYTQLGATTPNGILYCETETRTRPVSVADRLYFSRALSEHDFVIGEYVIGRVTLAPSMGLAYPILGDGDTVRGVVIAPLKLSWLAQRFAEIEIPVTGEMLVIDTYGNLLLRDPDATDWFGKNIAETPIGNAMLTKRQGSGDFAGADGETRYYAFASPQSSRNKLIVAVGIKK